MDLSSILSMTVTVIKSVHDNAALIAYAPKSCEFLKAELLSIQEILVELDNLAKEGNGDVRSFASNSSQYAELTSN